MNHLTATGVVSSNTVDFKEGVGSAQIASGDNRLSRDNVDLSVDFPGQVAGSYSSFSVHSRFKISSYPSPGGVWNLSGVYGVGGVAGTSWQIGILESNHSVTLTMGSFSVTVTDPIELDRWYCVGVAFDAATKTWVSRLYDYDTTLETIKTGSTGLYGMQGSSSPFILGGYIYYFDGLLDEVVVFNIAKTAAQMKQICQQIYPVLYTVIFNANGGSGSMSNQTASAATALTANAFTRTGYTFSGWNTAADGSGTAYADEATYAFAADATLYAQWTIIAYTVTFDSNGGSAISSQSVNYGDLATLPAHPTRMGYSFLGWYSDSGLNFAYDFSSPVTGNITLYAMWSGAEPVETDTTIPKICMRYSKDGGYTFGPEKWRGAGHIGEYLYRCRWPGNLGRARRPFIEISGSDFANISIVNAYVEIESGNA
jgi:uncharacterized repeat protein (TIGR02543 family)